MVFATTVNLGKIKHATVRKKSITVKQFKANGPELVWQCKSHFSHMAF